MREKVKSGIPWMILLVLLLLIGLGIWWWHQSQVVPLEEYLTQINHSMASEEYEEAMDVCQKALQDYPKEGTLYYKKAQIYQAQGETEMAIGILDYGYKQTGFEELKQLREEYDTSEEEDVQFTSPQLVSPEEQDGSEEVEDYSSYELPEISLPDVEPLPTPTPTPTPAPSQVPAESQTPEQSASSEEASSSENSQPSGESQSSENSQPSKEPQV